MVALRFGLDVVAVTLLTFVYFCAFLFSFISCWRPCAQVLKRMCPKRRSTLCRGTPSPPIWPPEKLKTAIFWDHSLEMQETMGHVTCGTCIQQTGEPFQACWKSNTLWTIPSSTVETWHFSWKKWNASKSSPFIRKSRDSVGAAHSCGHLGPKMSPIYSGSTKFVPSSSAGGGPIGTPDRETNVKWILKRPSDFGYPISCCKLYGK